MDKAADVPAPRLCHLLKWPDFDGFGFNLHGEKSKSGQYIGKVDPDSPAEAAGLKARDRIIEVNGTNISNENHKQVVERIKAVPDETRLLVVDERAEDYYRSRNIIVRGDMDNVIHLQTPPRQNTIPISITPTTTDKNGRDSDHDHEDVSDTGSLDSSSLPSKTNSLKKKQGTNGFNDSLDEEGSWEGGICPSPSTATPSPTPLNFNSASSNTKGSTSSLDLNMTAQEMRAKLAARKKADPKNSKMDLKKKYEIIQTL